MRAPAAIAFLALATGCAGGAGGENVSCAQGDFTGVVAGDDPRMGKVLDHLDQGWLADAVRCKAGAYTLLTPRDRTRHQYILLRDGAELPEVLRMGVDSVTVMDGYHLHATLTDSNNDGHADAIDYSTWRYDGERYVDAADFNLDGQPDLRHTETSDGSTTREAWVNGKWHGIVLENGIRLSETPGMRLRKNSDGTFEIAEEP